MKTCPKCGANYTAYIDFCFEDGGVLTLADTAGFGADDPTELDVPSPGNLPTSKRGPEITEEATQIAELQFTPAPSPPVRNSVGYTGGETPRAPEIQVLEEAPPPPSSTPEPEPVRTPERVPPKATPAEDFPTDTHERGSQRKVGLLLAAVGGLTAVVLVGVGVVTLVGGVSILSFTVAEPTELVKTDGKEPVVQTPVQSQPVVADAIATEDPGPTDTDEAEAIVSDTDADAAVDSDSDALANGPENSGPADTDDPINDGVVEPVDADTDPVVVVDTDVPVDTDSTGQEVPPDASSTTTPPAATPVKVMIHSNPPQAVITVEGESKGTAPVEVALLSGAYQVSAALEGYRNATKTLDVKDSEVNMTLTLTQIPKSGKVLVVAPPSVAANAVLYVDGKEKAGTFPLTVTMEEGEHTFSLVANGEKKTTVKVVKFAGEGMVIVQFAE